MLDGLLSLLGIGGGGQGILPPFASPPQQSGQVPSWLQNGGAGSVPFAGVGGLNAASTPRPASGPGIGDRLMAGFQGFVNSGAPLPALGNLVSGLVTGQRSDPDAARQQQVMALYGALRQRGLSEADARAAVTNPEFMKAVMPSAVPKFESWSNGQMSGSFNPASGRITPQVSVPKFETTSPGQTPFEYSPPLPGANAQQSDPSFTIPPSQVQRANAAPAPGATAPIVPNAVPTTSVPRAANGLRQLAPATSVVQHAADQEEGKAIGQARHSYPDTVATLSSTLENVQALKTLMDKPTSSGATVGDFNVGAGRGVGWLSSFLGGDSADFEARLKQLDSKSFMTAIQAMKGLGALSNAEGLKASTAFARLQTSQSPSVFKSSLTEVEGILRQGLARAKLQAFGQQRLNSGTAPTPPDGFTVIQ